MSVIDQQPSSAAAAILDGLRPDDIVAEYASRGLADLSDAELVAACTAVVATPKVAEPDSFVLHAPLEVAARARLLARIEPTARQAARQRLVWVAATYRAAGDDVPPPAARDYGDVEAAALDLARSVSAGDVDRADGAASYLERHADGPTLAGLTADIVVPSLAAAGHGPILLMHALALAPLNAAGPIGLRGVIRELARRPTWTLRWFHEQDTVAPRTAAIDHPAGDRPDLIEPLLRPRSPGPLSSNFIYPTMHLTESSGLAAEVLSAPVGSATPTSATHELCRVAAWSMLQDDRAHAPYGWSHCLTLPQAALRVASNCTEPRHAIAVAATYVLGSRATLGTVRLDPSWTPAPSLLAAAAAGDAPMAMLDGSPDEAAAAMWVAPPAARAALVRRLAARAACHADAHLAKYVLACLDAAAADPDADAEKLFLAAAAFLASWWREHPVAGDPLTAD